MEIESVTFETTDGVVLHGQVFLAADAIGTTILHGATGVPVGYYENFARWYASQKQHHVLIYAYRDTLDMSASKLRSSRTTMADWGILDQPAALEYMLTQYPDLPAHTIGHSLGGFCIPFHENAGQIVKHTAVNSGPAYFWAHPWHFIAKAFALWYLIGPISAWLTGYLPGKRIGLNADIPSTVYWQWRKWCTRETFYEDDWGSEIAAPDLSRFQGEFRIIATADDYVIPAKRVWELQRYFPNVTARKTLIDPRDYGMKELGHISIFSKRNSAVWTALL